MKNFLLTLIVVPFLFFLKVNAQTCRDWYKEANQLLEAGKLEKARAKYQQVIECGDNFYVPDSKDRIQWIERILQKPKKSTPFSLSDNQIVIPYQGGQDVITVDGDGSWTATLNNSGANWCKIKKEKGKVYILCTANESSSDRECELTVSMSGKTRKVKITNESAPEYLTPSVEKVNFTSKGETNSIDIRSNSSWVIENSADWLDIAKEDNRIVVTAHSNDNNKERKAEIKVESSSNTVIINIYQSAGLDHLSFSKNDLHFGPDGGDEYINVYTDADDWRLGDFPYWCQVTKVADNLLKVHCTSNAPINLDREASVNVTTGRQVLGINISQDPKPAIPMIPIGGIGGRALSFGFNAGYLFPFINTSSGGTFTGSVVNYARGDNTEEASYSSSGGFSIGATADIRIYKNLYLITGLNYIHYSYKNEFISDANRNLLTSSPDYYFRGRINDYFTENYSFNVLELPVLVSYRLPVTKTSHVQFNLGPIVRFGLSSKMKFSGNSDGEGLLAYKIVNHQKTGEIYDGVTPLPHHIKSEGEFDLYSKDVSYKEVYVERGGADVSKSQSFDASPFNRVNFGACFGVAYEYNGISFGVQYDMMLSNMANKRYWEGNRWTVFDQSSNVLISDYKQRNNYLTIKVGYTFRY